jgi:pimeloyl-ACP methyl ester carboxylesterase
MSAAVMTDVVFLPGIIAPAEARYRPLLDRLQGVNTLLKDLEIYASDQPPADYAVNDEIHGIHTAADQAGLAQFHLYGHSAGAACALAYATAHPERVLSLALDEPTTDFTPADRADPCYQEMDAATALPPSESVAAFLRLLAGPGVVPPAPPAGPPPEWMSKRPAALRVLAPALRQHHVDPADYAAFERPVLFTFGSLTNPRWRVMRDRLQAYFPAFTSQQFEGLHHLNTSHQAEPDRTAALLMNFWRAPRSPDSSEARTSRTYAHGA